MSHNHNLSNACPTWEGVRVLVCQQAGDEGAVAQIKHRMPHGAIRAQARVPACQQGGVRDIIMSLLHGLHIIPAGNREV